MDLRSFRRGALLAVCVFCASGVFAVDDDGDVFGTFEESTSNKSNESSFEFNESAPSSASESSILLSPLTESAIEGNRTPEQLPEAQERTPVADTAIIEDIELAPSATELKDPDAFFRELMAQQGIHFPIPKAVYCPDQELESNMNALKYFLNLLAIIPYYTDGVDQLLAGLEDNFPGITERFWRIVAQMTRPSASATRAAVVAQTF